MRIVYLHQYFLTPDMAGSTRSFEMARRLVAAGHEVHMVTTDQGSSAGGGWRESEEAGIHVHWAAVPYANEMGFSRRIAAFLRFALMATARAARLRGDVILATSTPLTIAIPALAVSWWKRVPFVFEVRDMWPDVPIAMGLLRNPVLMGMAKWLELTAYRRAAHVITLAPGMREDVIAKGISPGKITVIPNGCDLELFSTSDAGGSPRDEFPWLADRKLVLYAGSIGLVNGVDYLVRAAAETGLLDPEIRFVIIGNGRLKADVRRLAVELGVLDRNLFMLNAIPKRDLVRWLRAADLIVALITGPRVLWKDAVQNKFFDALAAGKPIASNFDGWQSQLAVEAGVGLVLDPSDTSVAARQIVEAVARSPGPDFHARARSLAASRFSRDELGKRLETVLVTAASGPAPAAA